MTLSELKKLAQRATPGSWSEDVDGDDNDVVFSTEYGFGFDSDDFTPAIVADCSRSYDMPDEMKHSNACFIAALNPSTALRMIELLEEASGFIRALNIVPPTKECEQMTAKWLKDLEEL